MPVRSVVKGKRGRGRPKLTWDESVKRDFRDWNISEKIALNRSAWRLAISVTEPWPLCLLGFISSLPQFAWDKRLCCCCRRLSYLPCHVMYHKLSFIIFFCTSADQDKLKTWRMHQNVI